MRRLWMIALFVGLAAGLSGAQQTGTAAAPSKADAHPARVKVYAVGPGVTAPELLPLGPIPIVTGNCKKKVDGKVEVSVIVDAEGRPRNVYFLRATGTDRDKLALQIVTLDRFKPGTFDGSPVAVGQSVEVNLQGCLEEQKDEAGKKTYALRLRSRPEQKSGNLSQPPPETVFAQDDSPGWDLLSPPPTANVGGSVKAPVPINNIEAEFTDAARRAAYQGSCMISFIVDRNGMPQNPRVLRKLDYGLTENALELVERYRFKPAMRNGEPVPVMITVEVSFQLR
jgi:TonB family protein